MERRTKIARVHCHGEKSAAYMADGYARASGKPGICMAQVIGALNLAAGLRDAWLAHSPVLAFTLAASSEIDAHRHITPLGKLLGHNALPVAVFVAAETVQHNERRSALTGTEVVGRMHDTG